jgi:RNA methyltransferase, TrmH family
MSEEMMITSMQNTRIKEVIKLRKRRERDEKKLFLIEGYRELLRATEVKKEMETLYYCPELFLGENEAELITAIQDLGACVIRCAKHVFEKISYRDRPDGLLAIAPHLTYSLEDVSQAIAGRKDPFIIVAEAIEKPGNLGTILRSADAAGADALIICDRCTDIHNPNVVKASVGTLFTRPVVEVSSEEAIAWLKDNDIVAMASTPSAEKEYTDFDMTKGIAIVLGTEQYGLSAKWLEQADALLRIPMKGTADSLNVAMASTILLFEVVRQRSDKCFKDIPAGT